MLNMEHELTCCVCLELYDKPLMLPCSHNFCRKCVLGLIQYIGQGAIRRSFNCPKCRRKIHLDGSRSGRLEGLPVNQTLDNIVKLYKSQNNTFNLQSDKVCSIHMKPQSAYCCTCKKIICQECTTVTHSGFGHVVKETADVIDNEKIKIQQALLELSTFKSEMKVRRQSLEQFILDAKNHEMALHKSNEDEIQQLVSALVLRKQQLNRAIFTCYQTTIRPAESIKNKFFYLESEANKLEKEFDRILEEKDLARQISLLQMFYTRVSSFLTFKANSIEELPEKMSIPKLEWENLDSLRDMVNKIHWTDESFAKKTDGPGVEGKNKITTRSFSLPGPSQDESKILRRQASEIRDISYSTSSLPLYSSPPVLSASSSTMSSPAFPSSPLHSLPTAASAFPFRNVFNSVAAKFQSEDQSISQDSSPECGRSPVSWSPASCSPSLKKKSVSDHVRRMQPSEDVAHAQQNIFNFSFVSSDNRLCASSQTDNGSLPQMNSTSTQTNNNVVAELEPGAVALPTEDIENPVKKREWKVDNNIFQPIKGDGCVRPKIYEKGGNKTSKSKSSNKQGTLSGSHVGNSFAEMTKMWGNLKVGSSARNPPDEPSTSCSASLLAHPKTKVQEFSTGFHFPADHKKLEGESSSFNFTSMSSPHSKSDSSVHMFVFGKLEEAKSSSDQPKGESMLDKTEACSSLASSKTDPVSPKNKMISGMTVDKPEVLSFYFEKPAKDTMENPDTNANVADGPENRSDQCSIGPGRGLSRSSSSSPDMYHSNGISSHMATTLGSTSSRSQEPCVIMKTASKPTTLLGTQPKITLELGSGLTCRVQNDKKEKCDDIFVRNPTFSVGIGSMEPKPGSPKSQNKVKVRKIRK